MKLFTFFRKKRKSKSGSIAKQRLKTLLISDRADCSANFINGIKGDIGLTLSKYMEVDVEHMEINIQQSETSASGETKMILVAKVPFREINKVIC